MKRESWLPAAPEGVPRARASVRELAAELRLDSGTTWELMLATTEAFANAVEHGRACEPCGILLRVEATDGHVGVEVSDCGGRFITPLSSKRLGEGGRGLPIIAAVTDVLEVLPETGRTRIRFEKRLAAA
jgi:serine/threonine-protein kinase RsbW